MKLKFILIETVFLTLLLTISCTEMDDPVSVTDSKWMAYTQKDGLTSNTVYSLAEDKDGVIWCGIKNGLCYLNKTQTDLFVESSDYQINSVVCADNYVIIATNEGGYVLYDDKWHYINSITKNCIDIEYKNEIAWCLYDDGEIYINDYYAGTEPECNDIYLNEDTVFYSTSSNVFRQWIQSDTISLLFSDSVYCNTTYKSKNDILWVGISGEKGIAKVTNGRFTFLNCGYITSIAEDNDGNMWFGSRRYGVYKLEPDGNIINYTLLDGLPSNWVNDILISNDGSVWVATENAGIAQLKQ